MIVSISIFNIISILLYIYFLSLHTHITEKRSRKILAVIVGGSLFSIMNYLFVGFFLEELFKFIILISLAHSLYSKEDKAYWLTSIMFLLISQFSQFLIMLFVSVLFKNNFILILNNEIIMFFYLSAVLCLEYFICLFISKEINPLLKGSFMKYKKPLFFFSAFVLMVNNLLVSYSSRYAMELYLMGSIMYIMFVIMYLLFYRFISYQNKFIFEKIKKSFYENKLEYLRRIAISNGTYQNDYHDLCELVLKIKDKLDSKEVLSCIDEYFLTHEYPQRFICKDETLNVIINSYINYSKNSDIQISDSIVDDIKIQELDMLILFNEIFNQIEEKHASISIISNINLRIYVKCNVELEVSEDILDIVRKYNGVVDRDERSLLIVLFYDQIGQ